MIRYRRSPDRKQCHLRPGDAQCFVETLEKSKLLGSGGSMVARLKLKGIDGSKFLTYQLSMVKY